MNVYNSRFLRIRPMVQDLFYGLQQLQSLFYFLALVCISAKINKNSFNNWTHIFFTPYSEIYDPGIMLIFNETTHIPKADCAQYIEMTPRVGYRPSFYLLHISGVY